MSRIEINVITGETTEHPDETVTPPTSEEIAQADLA